MKRCEEALWRVGDDTNLFTPLRTEKMMAPRAMVKHMKILDGVNNKTV